MTVNGIRQVSKASLPYKSNSNRSHNKARVYMVHWLSKAWIILIMRINKSIIQIQYGKINFEIDNILWNWLNNNITSTKKTYYKARVYKVHRLSKAWIILIMDINKSIIQIQYGKINFEIDLYDALKLIK